MKKLFGKDEPEDLTDRDLRVITDRLMDETSPFRYALVDAVRSAFITDINTRQIVLDKVNTLLDEILCNEDNRTKIKDAVIRQIDELHNVKILLDQIPHNKVESDRESVINQWTGQRDYDFVNLIVSACHMSRLNSVSPNITDPDASKRIIDEEIEELREEVKRRFR